MNHPFLKNSKFILLYFGIWILVSGIHFFVLTLAYSMPSNLALADSFIYNMLFSLLGIPVWYVVRFSKTGLSNVINLLINHLTTIIIIEIVWLGAGFLLMRLFVTSGDDYTGFVTSYTPSRIISGLFFYLIMILVYYNIIYYENIQEKLTSEGSLKEMVKQAELDMLRSQINPHFLFNSLNSISSMTMVNPAKAQEMIIKLSEFLRYSVAGKAGQMSTLADELENISRYLEIEQVRFGSRLAFSIEMTKEVGSLKLPAMILQPLYENAVKHGVYESTDTILIKTYIRERDELLEIIIENNFDAHAKSRKGTGIGHKNIRERLRLIYKNEQLLKNEIKDGKFIVRLMIPQN